MTRYHRFGTVAGSPAAGLEGLAAGLVTCRSCPLVPMRRVRDASGQKHAANLGCRSARVKPRRKQRRHCSLPGSVAERRAAQLT
jgi:hypothetical protein